MPYKYITKNETKIGNLSIIPNKHRLVAKNQKKSTILCHENGWFCPPIIVGIGECIIFELDEVQVNYK